MSGDWIVDEMAGEVQRRLKQGFSGVLTVTMHVDDGMVTQANVIEGKNETGVSEQDDGQAAQGQGERGRPEV